jgi:predicted outer membrane repeat protein
LFQLVASDFGGALFIQVYCTVYITGCTFRRNVAKFQGGAISLNSATATVVDSVFEDNVSEEGAVMFLIASSPVELISCNFTKNGVGTIAGGVMTISSLSYVSSMDSNYKNNSVSELLVNILFPH